MKKVIIWVCFLGTLSFVLGQSTMIVDYIESKFIDQESESTDAPKLLYQMGKYCYSLSNLERASECFKRVLEDHAEVIPWAPESLFMIGKIHEKKGEILQARLAFGRMEEDYPYEDEYLEKAAAKLLELERVY